jgi:DNA-directed RNA polymerase delta subunit
LKKRILRRIQHYTIRHILDDIVRPFQFVLEQAGGILKETQISEQISQFTVLGKIDPIGATRFVLGVTAGFEEIGDGIWALKECPFECFPMVTSTAALRLEKNHTRVRYNQLVSQVRMMLESTNNASKIEVNTLFIEACLQADPQFEISDDGWCMLAKWQKSYIDEMVEVLRENGKPLHFREIASGVEALVKGNQEVSEHNIHAVLQRRQDLFVRVGQGTYGLVEWGIQRPTYFMEIISDILEAEGKPLP